MDFENTNSTGNLKISNGVIATVSRVAVMEVEGVADVNIGSTKVQRWFSKSNYLKPIRVTMEDGAAAIDVCVIVKHGCNIPQLSLQIQQNVKSAVENMTGLPVSRVDIQIVGIAEEAAKTE